MLAQRTLVHVVAAVALGAALSLPARAPAQGRPDCAHVLRQLNTAADHAGARTIDSVKIAKKLHVDADWVERCAQAYGRRITRRPDPDHPMIEGDSELAERREAEEIDELSREEKQTLGDTYVTVIENDQEERKRLSRARDEDTINEWEPDTGHEWEPNTGHEWKPFLHYDDE